MQALRHYDRAIELDPTNKEAMCNKASALLKLKQWQEALDAADQVRLRHCMGAAPAKNAAVLWPGRLDACTTAHSAVRLPVLLKRRRC